MTEVTRSQRTATAIAFIAGGALLAVAALLALAASPAPEVAHILRVVADLAIATGFALLAFDTVTLPARIALIVASAGWLLFAIGEVAGLPGQLGTVAQLAAAGGGLVAAILLRASGWSTPRAAMVLLVSTAIYAVLIVLLILGVDLQGVGLLLTLLFAAGLIVVGALLLWPRRVVV